MKHKLTLIFFYGAQVFWCISHAGKAGIILAASLSLCVCVSAQKLITNQKLTLTW